MSLIKTARWPFLRNNLRLPEPSPAYGARDHISPMVADGCQRCRRCRPHQECLCRRAVPFWVDMAQL
eukprot:292976-Prorocentrum_lima.AAC.1